MVFENSLEFAHYLDKKDTLRHFRDRFIIPSFHHAPSIYFLGNSLGLQPRHTVAYLEEILEAWGNYGVEAFFKGRDRWLDYHDQLIEPLSKIVGALPHEVVVMNQLTVNLHLMLVSFYQPQGIRTKILCEAKAFPSDQYVLETHVRHRGLDPDTTIIEVPPRPGEYLIREEDIFAAIEQNKEQLALVFWGGVNYYTGQAFSIDRITEAAQQAGAKAGFDLAHAAGNIELDLHNWNVDFACWCSYKYLNSGPGAIAGAYIHERYHQDQSLNRFAGWWGYKKESRFLMQKGFHPVPAAEGWQLSTPSPLLYASHKAALEIFDEAGMQLLTEKAQLLSDFLVFLMKDLNGRLPKSYFTILTPEQAGKKGCQISILVSEQGKFIFDELTNNGVFADWREPDVIRVAPVPLYNTFDEVWRFVQHLERAIKKIQ